ncbi:SMAD/FHA domain-containing protein [Apiospora arundinis]
MQHVPLSDTERETSEDRDKGRRRHRRSRSPRSPKPRRRSRSRDDERRHRRGRDGESRDSDGGRAKEGGSRRRSRDRGSHDSRRRKDRDDEDKDKQVVRRSGPLPSQSDSFAVTNGEEPPKPKEQPNFGITGTLAAASNSIAQADGSTIVLKYHEPPEARKPSPKDAWKLFVFKGADIIDTIELSHRSCWLVGRELAVVDMIAEHPSISKQHAVIQFRYQEKRNEYGDKIGKVKPYLLDLESANGTMLNSKKIPDSRYLELKDKDLVQFGQSTREYVLMFERK